jgi:hypothetical protein
MYFGFRDLEVEVAAPRLRFGPLSAHQPSAYRRGFGKTLLFATFALKFADFVRVYVWLTIY